MCILGQDVNPWFIRGYDYIIKTLILLMIHPQPIIGGVSMIMSWGGICNVRYDHSYGIMVIMGQHVSAVFYNSVVLRNHCSGNHMWYVSVNWRSIWIDMAVMVKCSHGTRMWNIWSIMGQHVNVGVMVVIDYVSKVLSNHIVIHYGSIEGLFDRYGSYGWNVVMALACGIWVQLMDTCHAVLMVVIDYVSKVLSTICDYITTQLIVNVSDMALRTLLRNQSLPLHSIDMCP